MGLKDWLQAGHAVLGSPFDNNVKNLFDLNQRAAQRLGYLDSDGYVTDKGWQRATSQDYQTLIPPKKS